MFDLIAFPGAVYWRLKQRANRQKRDLNSLGQATNKSEIGGMRMTCPQLLGPPIKFAHADKPIGVTVRVSGAGG